MEPAHVRVTHPRGADAALAYVYRLLMSSIVKHASLPLFPEPPSRSIFAGLATLTTSPTAPVGLRLVVMIRTPVSSPPPHITCLPLRPSWRAMPPRTERVERSLMIPVAAATTAAAPVGSSAAAVGGGRGHQCMLCRKGLAPYPGEAIGECKAG